jgi:hypothetical protein
MYGINQNLEAKFSISSQPRLITSLFQPSSCFIVSNLDRGKISRREVHKASVSVQTL